MRRTEIWLLSASTASRYFPSRSYLGRALGGEARTPGAERGVGKRGKGAVGVPGEPVDGIGRSGVAVRGCLLIGSPSRHRSGDRAAGRHRGGATGGRRNRRMVESMAPGMPGPLPGAGRGAVAVQDFGLVLVPRARRPVRVDDQGPAPPVNHDLMVERAQQDTVLDG